MDPKPGSVDTAPSEEAVSSSPPVDPTLPRPRPSPPIPREEPRLAGRYRVVRELGRGGMGIVFVAHDEVLDRHVALKRLVQGVFASSSDIERFEREARAAARVQHPGLVRVHDMDMESGEPFFTMDLVDGRSLRHHLSPGKPWAPQRAASLVAEVARALAAAHAQGLVHRDVKPENILVRASDGAPLLTDFGIARLNDRSGDLTRTGEMLGTPAYMPPEQALGQKDRVGPASDIYSLGAVLYELLAGRKAYEGSSVSVLGALLTRPPPRLRTLGGDLPLPLCAICERAMAREPESRYASAADLADDLDRFIAGRPVRALEGRRRLAALEVLREHSRTLGAGLALLGLVGLALGGRAWMRARAEEQRQSAANERLASLESRMGALIADGRLDEAQALYRTFVQLPENRGTSALTHAWIGEGQRLQRKLEEAASLSAFASAYTSAERQSDQDDALLAMSHAFVAFGHWSALAAALERLRERGVDPAELTDLDVSLALGRHDIGGALGAWPAKPTAAMALGRGQPSRSLLTSLQGSTPLGASLFSCSALAEGVGPPGAAFICAVRHTHRYNIYDSNLNELASIPVGDGAELERVDVTYLSIPGQPLRILEVLEPRGDKPLSSLMLTLDGDRIEVEAEWEGRRMMSGAVVPTPWGPDILGGEGPYSRDMQWIRPDGDGGWRLQRASLEVSSAESDVHELLVADMDGDGEQELVVALGAWQAMDVRIMKVGAGPDDDVRSVARSRLGVVSDVAVLHPPGGPEELVLWRMDSPTNAQVFGADPNPPPGEGLFRFVLRDGKLERHVQRLNGPVSTGTIRGLIVADLDGDGGEEVVATGEGGLSLLRRSGEDDWDALVVPQVVPVLAINLDEDPALELVVEVRDEPVAWVMGLGSTPLPPSRQLSDLPTLPRVLAPLADPALAAGRERALQVAALGLDRDAAGYLDSLAAVAASDDDRGALQVLAGQLWEGARRTVEAQASYKAAAGVPATEIQALEGLVRVLELEHRYEEAAAANQRLLQVGGPLNQAAAAARAQGLNELAGADSVALDLRVGLPPGLIVEDPLAVKASPGRGLLINSPIWEGAVARLPLRCEGPRVGIEARLKATNTDWASTLRVSLAPPGTGAGRGLVSIGLLAGGGGSSTLRHMDCGWADTSSRAIWSRENLASWGEADDLVARFDATRAPVQAVCQGGNQRGALEGSVIETPGALPEGDVDLIIGGAPWGLADPAQTSSIELQSLTIWGCTPREGPTLTVAQRAARALASGDARGALTLYRGVPGDEGAIGQAAALLAMGQVEEAADAVARLQAPRVQRVWLLQQSPTLTEALLGRWGLPALSLLVDAAGTNSEMGPLEPGPLALLSSADLTGVRPEQIGPDGVNVLWRLYTLRARSALAVGDLTRARGDIEAALALPPPTGDRHNLLSRCRELRVSLLIREGDLAGALEEVQLTVRTSATPEITQDRLAMRAEVVPFLNDPAWRAALGR